MFCVFEGPPIYVSFKTRPLGFAVEAGEGGKNAIVSRIDTESEDPNRHIPNADTVEPIRDMLRTESVLPACEWSKTEMALPNLAMPKMLTELPMREYDRRDKVLPK